MGGQLLVWMVSVVYELIYVALWMALLNLCQFSSAELRYGL